MAPRDDLGSVSGLALPGPDAAVRYAAHDDGLVDVHLPVWTGSARPRLVVLLHGGFWRQAYDRRHTRPVAAALATEGYVVATPEYRRVGGAGGWPRTGEDVEAALTALPALLDGLGIGTLGATLLGHSAGGHLALWASSLTVARDLGVDLAVGLAPVGHLRAAARDRVGDGAVQALLGGEPDEVAQRYDAADPAFRFRTRPPCDVRVVHGTRDDIVPPANSRELAAEHPFVELRPVEGADHFDLMNPASAAWPAVLDALRCNGLGAG